MPMSCCDGGTRLMTLGGDHTIALPLLRSLHRDHGPVAVLHFDAHLDTWDTYFGAAVHPRHPVPPGQRGGAARHPSTVCTSASAARCTARRDLTDDRVLGFQVIGSDDVDRRAGRR